MLFVAPGGKLEENIEAGTLTHHERQPGELVRRDAALCKDVESGEIMHGLRVDPDDGAPLSAIAVSMEGHEARRSVLRKSAGEARHLTAALLFCLRRPENGRQRQLRQGLFM